MAVDAVVKVLRLTCTAAVLVHTDHGYCSHEHRVKEPFWLLPVQVSQGHLYPLSDALCFLEKVGPSQ